MGISSFLKNMKKHNKFDSQTTTKYFKVIIRSSNQIDSWLTVDLTNKKLEKKICGRSGNQIDSWLTVDLKSKQEKTLPE